MATTSTRFTGPETQEAFLADRQKFWASFTSFTVGSVIFVVVLLALMGLFLI
jgi:hypothetical protein